MNQRYETCSDAPTTRSIWHSTSPSNFSKSEEQLFEQQLQSLAFANLNRTSNKTSAAAETATAAAPQNLGLIGKEGSEASIGETSPTTTDDKSKSTSFTLSVGSTNKTPPTTNRYVILPGGMFARPSDLFVETMEDTNGDRQGCLAMVRQLIDESKD